jgi:hypothetical protein
MNHPTPFPETAPALALKESAFSTPTTTVNVDALQPSSSELRAPLQFEWDDFDTGTLDDLP